jgi:hypothetical protein
MELARKRERKEDREKIEPKRDEEIRVEKKGAENGRGNRGNENRVSEHQNGSGEMRNVTKREKKNGETRERKKE